MKTLLFFAGFLAYALTATVPPAPRYQTVPEYKPESYDYYQMKKTVYRLFKNVYQPNYYPEFEKIGYNYDIQANSAAYSTPKYAFEFFEYYKNGVLPKGQAFSIFYDQHQKEAIAFFRLLYSAVDFDTFYKTACWGRMFLNEGLYIYSLSVALVHRPDTWYIELPPIYELYPYFFYNANVFEKLQEQLKGDYTVYFKPAYEEYYKNSYYPEYYQKSQMKYPWWSPSYYKSQKFEYGQYPYQYQRDYQQYPYQYQQYPYQYQKYEKSQYPYLYEQYAYQKSQYPYQKSQYPYQYGGYPYQYGQYSYEKQQYPYEKYPYGQYPYEESQYPYQYEKYPNGKSEYPHKKSEYPYEKSVYSYKKSQYPYEKFQYPSEQSEYPYEKTQYPYLYEKYAYQKSQYPYQKSQYPFKYGSYSSKYGQYPYQKSQYPYQYEKYPYQYGPYSYEYRQYPYQKSGYEKYTSQELQYPYQYGKNSYKYGPYSYEFKQYPSQKSEYTYEQYPYQKQQYPYQYGKYSYEYGPYSYEYTQYPYEKPEYPYQYAQYPYQKEQYPFYYGKYSYQYGPYSQDYVQYPYQKTEYSFEKSGYPYQKSGFPYQYTTEQYPYQKQQYPYQYKQYPYSGKQYGQEYKQYPYQKMQYPFEASEGKVPYFQQYQFGKKIFGGSTQEYPKYFELMLYKWKQQYPEKYYQQEREKIPEQFYYDSTAFNGITIDANYSWYGNNPEYSMSYFTEDVGLNAFYYYYHIYFPFWMTNEEIYYKTERRGEQYYYLYQQLLARYNLERISNGLSEVPLLDFDGFVETGYQPFMVYPNGVQFPERPDNAPIEPRWPQSFQYYDNDTLSVTNFKLYERRIFDAIDSGFVFTRTGKFVSIFEPEGFEILGNLIQTNPESPNARYYGSVQVFARYVLGYSKYPVDQYYIAPSVLEQFETSMRDPAFYQLYKRIVYYFQRYKQYLPRYSANELFFSGVKIEDVSVEKLYTYFDYFYTDISNAVYSKVQNFEQEIPVRVRQYRLNHKPFTYSLNVNSERPYEVVVRVFLGPKYNEFGKSIDINKNRLNFVELDKFQYSLQPGVNVIERNSRESYYIKDRTSYRELWMQVFNVEKPPVYETTPKEVEWGMPQRLLLPKGTTEGQMFQMYFIITPYQQFNRKVDDSKYFQYEPTLFWDNYNDYLPMGYPFDRPIDETVFFVPNSYFKDVVIYNEGYSDVYREYQYSY